MIARVAPAAALDAESFSGTRAENHQMDLSVKLRRPAVSGWPRTGARSGAEASAVAMAFR